MLKDLIMVTNNIFIEEIWVKFDNRGQLLTELEYGVHFCENQIQRDFFNELKLYIYRDDPICLSSAKNLYESLGRYDQEKIDGIIENIGF